MDPLVNPTPVQNSNPKPATPAAPTPLMVTPPAAPAPEPKPEVAPLMPGIDAAGVSDMMGAVEEDLAASAQVEEANPASLQPTDDFTGSMTSAEMFVSENNAGQGFDAGGSGIGAGIGANAEPKAAEPQFGGGMMGAIDPITMPDKPKAPDPVEEELKAPMVAAPPVPGSIGSAVSMPSDQGAKVATNQNLEEIFGAAPVTKKKKKGGLFAKLNKPIGKSKEVPAQPLQQPVVTPEMINSVDVPELKEPMARTDAVSSEDKTDEILRETLADVAPHTAEVNKVPAPVANVTPAPVANVAPAPAANVAPTPVAAAPAPVAPAPAAPAPAAPAPVAAVTPTKMQNVAFNDPAKQNQKPVKSAGTKNSKATLIALIAVGAVVIAALVVILIMQLNS